MGIAFSGGTIIEQTKMGTPRIFQQQGTRCMCEGNKPMTASTAWEVGWSQHIDAYNSSESYSRELLDLPKLYRQSRSFAEPFGKKFTESLTLRFYCDWERGMNLCKILCFFRCPSPENPGAWLALQETGEHMKRESHFTPITK